MASLTRSDRDHLRILAICHYVLSALCFIFGSLPLIHLAIGIAIVTGAIPMQQKGNGPPFPEELFGWFFIVFASFAVLFNWSLAVGLIVAGRSLTQRKRRTFCLVVAGAACMLQPLGLVLGIFTFLVLLRPSVRAAFEPVPEEPEERSEYDSYYSE